MAEELELARLVAQLDADTRPLTKQMAKLSQDFNAAMKSLEKKTDASMNSISARLAKPLKFSGLDELKKGLLGATAIGLGAGLVDVVDKALDAAAAIGEVAEQSGQTTDRVQEFRFAMVQTGASIEDADKALIGFSARYGEFVNTGAGKGAQAFKDLGIDKLVDSHKISGGDAGQAFDASIAKIQTYKTEVQKAGFLTALFGKEIGPKLLPYVDMGADGISKAKQRAHELGVVLSGETISGAKDAKREMGNLFYTIETQGENAIATFAPQIAALADQVLNSLPTLIKWVQKWGEWFGMIKESPHEQIQDQIDALKARKANLSDAGNPDKPGNMITRSAAAKDSIADLDKQIAERTKAQQKVDADQSARDQAAAKAAKAKADAEAKANLIGIHNEEAIKAAQEAAKAAAEALKGKLEELQSTLDAVGVHGKDAFAKLTQAQGEAAVELARGTPGFEAATIKAAVDAAKAETDKIDADAKKQLDGLDKSLNDIQDKAAKAGTPNSAPVLKAKKQITDAKGVVSNAAGEDKQVIDLKTQSQIGGEYAGSLRDQTQALKDQMAALGMTSEQADRNTVALKSNRIATYLDSEGYHDLAQKVRDAAAGYDVASKAEDEAAKASQKNVQELDDVRSGLEDVGAAGTKGFKSMKSAASDFVEQLAAMIIKLEVLQPLVEKLLGPQGTTGQGLLGSSGPGGGAGNLFGLLGSSGGFSSQSAAIAGNEGISLDAIPSTVSTSAAGSGLFDWIGSLFDFLADGGPISGPGGPRSDRIPIMASNGEFVVNADATKKYGPFLDAINRGKKPKPFANGGHIGSGWTSNLHADMARATGRMRGAATQVSIAPVFHIDARYATEGTAAMIQTGIARATPGIMRSAAQMAVKQSDMKFASNFFKTARDKA